MKVKLTTLGRVVGSETTWRVPVQLGNNFSDGSWLYIGVAAMCHCGGIFPIAVFHSGELHVNEVCPQCKCNVNPNKESWVTS